MPIDESSAQVGASLRIDDIIALAAEGLTDKEIATKLGISSHTVATHWKRRRASHDHKNRTAAVLEHLKHKIEEQNRELREAHASLKLAHESHRSGVAAMLADAHRRLGKAEATTVEAMKHLRHFQDASQTCRTVVYELVSVSPVAYGYVSDSMKALGTDPESMLKSGVTFYDLIHPDDLPLIIEKSMGATYLPNERYFYIYRLKTPEPRWVIDTHQAIMNEHGTLTGILGTVMDVHELVLAGVIRPEVTRVTLSQ